MQRLIVATHNPGKEQEIKALLRGLPLKVISLLQLPALLLPEEDEDSYAGNALKKARAIRESGEARGAVIMADDSGLEVEALGGRPGVHTARFAGCGAGDEANNRLLLEKMRGLPPEKRAALFRCVIALLFPGGEEELIDESCRGRIAEAARGRSGFGYDPLFIYEPAGLTFAEMGEAEKNKVSHRGKALRRARLLLTEPGGRFSRHLFPPPADA